MNTCDYIYPISFSIDINILIYRFLSSTYFRISCLPRLLVYLPHEPLCFLEYKWNEKRKMLLSKEYNLQTIKMTEVL